MKGLIWFLAIAFAMGCWPHTTNSTTTARHNLLQLKPGISNQQVIHIMGTPYRNEAYSIEGGSLLEAYFYVTDNQPDYWMIEDMETTPIIFLDGKVVGWGWSFYKDTTQKYDIKLNLD